MNFVAYCRVSTEKEDQINSLKAQKDFFREFAKRRDYNLVKIYADEGLPGTRMKKREALLELLEDSKGDSFTLIAVKDVSRLARNTVDFLNIIRQLKKNNKKVLFVSYNMDTQEASEFTLTMLAAMAQEESHNISYRVKFGKNITAKKGKVPNFTYGYDKLPDEIYTLGINEFEADIVNKIFYWYTSQEKGATRIALELNEAGIKTKGDKLWEQNTVVRILRNEIYIGVVINGMEEVKDFLTGERTEKPKEEWYVAYKPDLAIIDVDVFKKAQSILKKRKDDFKLTGKRTSNKYLFTTLIKCKHCNYSYRRMVRTYKNTYVRWVCSGRNQKGTGTCPNATVIDEPEMKKVLNQLFLEISKSKATYIDIIKKEFKRIYEQKNKSLLSKKELQSELIILENSKKKELDLYRLDAVTEEELTNNLKPIKKQINKITQQLELVQQDISVSDKASDILENTFNHIEDMVDVDNMSNIMLKQIVEKIEVDKDKNVVVHLKVLGAMGIDATIPFSENRT